MKIVGRKSLALLVASLVGTGWGSLSSADTGILTWNMNTEADLAGFKAYRSTTSGVYGAPVATLGKVTAYNIDLPALSVDTRYFVTITAYDLAGNESAKSSEVSKLVVAVPVAQKPGTPVLTITARTTTSITVSYPPVPDGLAGSGTASVNIRSMLTPMSWGLATSAPCTSSPCTITGLLPDTAYDVQAVAYRGTPNVNAVFGALSAVMSTRTVAADLPPSPPQGLVITKATESEIVIVASAADCTRVTTSTTGSTSAVLKRTVRCVR